MIQLNLYDNSGQQFDLSKYLRGSKLGLVFFRGAWCNFCKTQLKELQNNLATINKTDTKIIAVSSDTKLNSSLLKEFLHLNFPVLSDSNFEIIDKFQLRTKYKDKDIAKPAVIIFDNKGSELYRFVGQDYNDRLPTHNLLKVLEDLSYAS